MSKFERVQFSCGAKTFIIGEYAALIKGPALIVATKPRIEMTVQFDSKKINQNLKKEEVVSSSFLSYQLHPDSLAALLGERNITTGQKIKINIDLEKKELPQNGLGISTAEYLAIWAMLKKQNNPQEKLVFLNEDLETYQNLSKSKITPSGYDLISQFYGGLQAISYHLNRIHVHEIQWSFPKLGFLLCYTHNKVETHSHLQTLNNTSDLKILSQLSEQTIEALRNKNESDFIAGIEYFQAELMKQEKVSLNTLEILQKLAAESLVLAAKGCGAMGADVICLFSHDVDALRSKIKKNHSYLTPFATHLDITEPMKIDSV